MPRRGVEGAPRPPAASPAAPPRTSRPRRAAPVPPRRPAAAEPPTRFATLDGLRGVGAILVMIGHGTGQLRSGYPAVDFFFLHSGFVLAYANWERRDRPHFGREFAVRRLIRIYPVYLVGALLGALMGLVLVRAHDPAWSAHGLLLALALALAFAPDFSGGVYGVCPLNMPMWSLFFEMCASLLFAASRFRIASAAAVALVSAPLLLLSYHLWLDGGGSTAADFPGGFARAGYAFSAGVLVCALLKTGRLPRWRSPWWACWATLPLLYVPVFGGGNGYIALVALVVQPVLAVTFVQSRMPDRLVGLASWLGLTSYALYCVHLPLQYLFETAARLELHSDRLAHLAWLLSAPLSLGLAHLLTFHFDIPARRGLTRLWERRGGIRGGAAGASGGAEAAAP